jgi:hypothetical protein
VTYAGAVGTKYVLQLHFALAHARAEAMVRRREGRHAAGVCKEWWEWDSGW